jgi:hypothetical protein
VANWRHDFARFDPVLLYAARGGGSATRVVLKRKLAIKGKIDGVALLHGIRQGRTYPYIGQYIGNDNLFSGYPSGYVNSISYGRVCAQVLCNPFLNPLNGTRWYERWRLAVTVEGGGAEYFDDGRQFDILLSAETAAQFYFYLLFNRECFLYGRIAAPLRPIEDGYPQLRMYWGLSM